MTSSEKAQTLVKALISRNLDLEYSGMPFSLKSVSNTKILSLVKSTINISRAQPKPPVYPIHLHVETSSACDLRCPLCPGGLGMTPASRGQMSFNSYKALIDEVGDHVIYALLWGWGEPCLNKRFSDMVAYAGSKKIATVASTNGQHIQTRDEAEAIVAAGLDCLIVSMDGATQETYSQYRIGGDINKIFRCLEMLHAAKKSLGSPKPFVNVQTVVLKHNEHELEEIEAIARRYGAEMVTRMSSHIPDYAGDGADERFAPSDSQYKRFEYRDGQRVKKSIDDYHCIRPWDRLTVTWDGRVIACEHDFSASLPFGQGGEGSSFLQAWRGETASAFRDQFLKAKSAYSFCADCHYRDSVNECLVDSRFLKKG